MIIYDATVNEFREHVKNSKLLAMISYTLKTKFGIRVSDSEMRSWGNSLPEVLKLLPNEKDDNRSVLCEFNIPTSKKRIDFIILGKNKNNYPSGWILELKQWSKVNEVGYNEFLIGRYVDTHPSYQASNYMYSLNEEMGLAGRIDLKASSFLHNIKNEYNPLLKNWYKDTLTKAALFTSLNKSILSSLIDEQTYIRNGKDAKELFKEAHWKPTKKLNDIIKNNFVNIKLLGSQKIIFEKIERFIKSFLDIGRKITFLISGDPGSGKTIIAFKLLHLLTLKSIEDHYGPTQMMIPGQEVRAAFKDKFSDTYLGWKISGSNIWKNHHLVIIDEGHKAIGRDVGSINYVNNYKKMNIAIIFIDDDQVINKKGITKYEIKQIAKKNGHEIHEYNIEENFRALGERTLLDWIDYVFYNKMTQNGEWEYEQFEYNNNNQHYKLYSYDSAKDFSESYINTRKKYKQTRIVSLWSEGYYLGDADDEGLPYPAFKIGEISFIWNPNKEWADKLKANNEESYKTYNKHVKRFSADRKLFLTDNPHPRFIAYFNHIQGYEFDNIFVYIPNVFTYDKNENKILFHVERLAKEVRASQAWVYNSKSEKIQGKTREEIYQLNKGFFINRIKVMLTRGVLSTHVFAEDEELNKYISSKIVKDKIN